MGQIHGNLQVREFVPVGRAPAKTNELCLVRLDVGNDSGTWLGACSSSVVNAVTNAEKDSLVGYFTGCPSRITLDPQPPGAPTKGHGPYPNVGSCNALPINISTATARTVLEIFFVVFVGLLFAFSMLMLYGHRDSTNTDIYAVPPSS
jgi:hypothetical protein